MDGPGDYYTNGNHSDGERGISYDVTYLNLKKKKGYKLTYFPNRKRIIDSENEFMVTRGMGWGRGIDWELGMDMYTLLYLKQIISKDLLYNTGNSAL